MKAVRYRYIYLVMAGLGILGGLAYWHFWGCTDSCPIDSSWKWSSLRGGLIGLCAAAFFHPSRKKSAGSPSDPEQNAP